VRDFSLLLKTPGLARIVATQLLARMPAGMFSIGLLMHSEHVYGNYASGGAVLAALSIGMAVAGPVISRQLSRWGTLPVLLTCLLLATAALTPMILIPLPLWAMTMLAAIAGATIPPVQPTVRTLYPKLVPHHLVTPLFGLDAALQEIIWVLGPVGITTMVVLLGSVTALLIVVALQLVGVVLFIFEPPVRELRIPKATGGFGRVALKPAVLLMTVTSLLLIGSLAGMEAAVVAWFGEGSTLGGFALAISSIGSLIGGLIMGHRPLGPWSLPIRLLVVAVGLGLASMASGFWTLSATLFAAGFGMAPAIAAVSSVIAASVPFADTAEAYGWITTGQLMGAALGAALAGVAIDASGGGAGGMLVSFGIGALAAVVATLFRGAQPDLRRPQGHPHTD
jgi:ABC transporter, permease protein